MMHLSTYRIITHECREIGDNWEDKVVNEHVPALDWAIGEAHKIAVELADVYGMSHVTVEREEDDEEVYCDNGGSYVVQ